MGKRWWETHKGRLGLLVAFILAEVVLYAVIIHLPRELASLETSLDGLVPLFLPIVLVYVLKAPLVFGALLVAYRKPAVYKALAFGLLAVTLLSEAIFLAYPTAPPRPALGDSFLERFTAGVYAFDGPANEFPSIHASQSVFLALFILATMASRWAYPLAGLFSIIAVSTVLVKQHTVAGLLGGILMGTLVFAVVKRRALLRLGSREK